MPTFVRFAVHLLVLGLIAAAVVYFVRSSSDSVDPPQAEMGAEPNELADELESGTIGEGVRADEQGLIEGAESEAPETRGEEAIQGPELDEGEVTDPIEEEPYGTEEYIEGDEEGDTMEEDAP